MSDRGGTEFKGDVGQAVIGTVNEAPKLQNVVNFNLQQEESSEPITELQRKMISSRVHQLTNRDESGRIARSRAAVIEFKRLLYVEVVLAEEAERLRIPMALPAFTASLFGQGP